jgi:hypothetical protein
LQAVRSLSSNPEQPSQLELRHRDSPTGPRVRLAVNRTTRTADHRPSRTSLGPREKNRDPPICDFFPKKKSDLTKSTTIQT